MPENAQQVTQTPGEPEIKQPEAAPVATNAQIIPPTTPAAPTTSQAPSALVLGEDGDIPTDAALVQMSPKALKSRLERHSRKELRERFGIDDPGEIQKRLNRLAELEKEAETRRLSEMTEQERLKEQLQSIERSRDEWKTKYREQVRAQSIATETNRVVALASKHVKQNPTYIRTCLSDLQDHLLKTYTEEQLAELPDAKIEEFFTQWVHLNPELGVGYGAAPLAEEKKAEKPLERVPLTNGMREPPPPPPKGPPPVRSFSPTADNAMSPQEARAAARKLGFDY